MIILKINIYRLQYFIDRVRIYFLTGSDMSWLKKIRNSE